MCKLILHSWGTYDEASLVYLLFGEPVYYRGDISALNRRTVDGGGHYIDRAAVGPVDTDGERDWPRASSCLIPRSQSDRFLDTEGIRPFT